MNSSIGPNGVQQEVETPNKNMVPQNQLIAKVKSGQNGVQKKALKLKLSRGMSGTVSSSNSKPTQAGTSVG